MDWQYMANSMTKKSLWSVRYRWELTVSSNYHENIQPLGLSVVQYDMKTKFQWLLV